MRIFTSSGNRDTESVFRQPSRIQSVSRSVVIYVKSLAPFSKRFSVPSDSDDAVVTSVSALFFAGSPTTVRRFIDTVRVNPVNRVLRGRRVVHVVSKVLERMPAFTNHNPAPAVTCVSLVLRRFTAIKHRDPYAINTGVATPVREHSCALPTRTAFCIAAAKTGGWHETDFPTIAKALPDDASKPIPRNGLDCQKVSKRLIGQVKESASAGGNMSFRHRFSCLESVIRGFRVFTHPAASFV